jgi:Na+-translocating ferredoxin:NAD+ oxidoreductase subunit B
MPNRREFLNVLCRGTILTGLAAVSGVLVYRSVKGGNCSLDTSCGTCGKSADCDLPRATLFRNTVWQLDPAKCIHCGRCADTCVMTPSAVKATHVFAMCGYCDLCGGYLKPGTKEISTAAENQLCPTSAIKRKFVEDPFYQYTIEEALCIGCAKCVKGCSAFGNGSLQLQVHHDRCVNCNECAIARNCPSDAFSRVPADKPYLLQGTEENKSAAPAPENKL